MKMNKFLVILGVLFFIGFVGASEQEYNIMIRINHVGDSSGEILMNVIAPENNTIVGNPIEFDIEINYSNFNSLSCELSLDGWYNVTFDPAYHLSFYNFSSDDFHNWDLRCYDGEEENSSSGSFKVEDVNFNFSNIENNGIYFNDKPIEGSFGFTKDIQFFLNGNNITSNVYFLNGDFRIDKSYFSNAGYYNLTVVSNYFENTLTKSIGFYVVSADVSLDDDDIDLGETADIKVDINHLNFPGNYKIYIDGSSSSWKDVSFYATSGNISESFNYTPNAEKDYEIKLVVNVGTKSFSKTITLDVDGDTKKPVVNLVYPANDEIVREENITFVYNVSDDSSLSDAECKFMLYDATYYPDKSLSFIAGEKIFPLSIEDNKYAVEKDLANNNHDEIEVDMYFFEEQAYYWEVECTDSSGNKNVYDGNFFLVDFNGKYSNTENNAMDYARESEIGDLLNKADSFLESIDNIGLNENKILNLLKLEDNVNSYKKLLKSWQSSLADGMRGLTQEQKDRQMEIIDKGIDEIMENMIIGIHVGGEPYEYSKSSLGLEVEDVLTDYFDATNQNIGGSALKKIIRGNEELQDSLRLDGAEVFAVDVEYFDGVKKMILVNKKFDIDSNPADKLLEVIPEDLSKDVYFTVDSDDIGEGIWEVLLSDLENEELTYYFFSEESLQNIQKTESLLFGEEIRSNVNLITGFVTGVGEIGSAMILPFLLLSLFMGYVGFIIFEKARLEVWKKEPNVVRILDLMKRTKLLLKENKVLDARENYRQMGEIYKVLPNKCKNFFFNEIKIIRLAIDKKDVLNLIIEYEKARSENRLADASELHSKISEIYKKLPKKFQDKVYQRLIKNEVK